MERKVARQEKVEQKKAAIAARIASKAAARLARAAAPRQNAFNQDVRKNSRRKKKQLQKPREVQDDEDMIVVKNRLSNPNTVVSSSSRLIKPSKRLRQEILHMYAKRINTTTTCNLYGFSAFDAFDVC